MRLTLLSSLALALILSAAGCGYKGPLYLPDQKPAAKKKSANNPPANPAPEKSETQ